MLDEARMFGRYVAGLREFVRTPLGREECRRRIGEQLRGRGEVFLRILERGIYARPRSPYYKLLRHAGSGVGDMAALVRQEGVEAALGKLHEAGVYVTLDEFKGRRGIERPGLPWRRLSRVSCCWNEKLRSSIARRWWRRCQAKSTPWPLRRAPPRLRVRSAAGPGGAKTRGRSPGWLAADAGTLPYRVTVARLAATSAGRYWICWG